MHYLVVANIHSLHSLEGGLYSFCVRGVIIGWYSRQTFLCSTVISIVCTWRVTIIPRNLWLPITRNCRLLWCSDFLVVWSGYLQKSLNQAMWGYEREKKQPNEIILYYLNISPTLDLNYVSLRWYIKVMKRDIEKENAFNFLEVREKEAVLPPSVQQYHLQLDLSF